MTHLLMDNLLRKAAERTIPLVATVELTQNCNYRCGHCYNFNRTSLAETPKLTSLSSEKIKEIIDQLAEAGTLYLNLSGGEVLLHPDLDDFIRQGRQNKMEVRLKTNASLLSTERCRNMYSAGLAGMDVSLYGYSEESYSRLTGKNGMFAKTIAGILNAKEQKFDLNISIIIHRYNVSEIKQMVEFCQKNLLPFQFSIEMTERYDGSSGARDFEMTEEQFKEQLEGEFAEVFMVLNEEKNLQCSCAKSVCGVSANGEVFPCIGAPIPSGNLINKTFKEIWANSPVLNQIRKLKKEDFKECMTCEHILFCNRSSGSTYVNTGKYTGCDPGTLKLAKIRHELFLKNKS